MPSLRSLFEKWRADKDERGRSILYIGSSADIQRYLTHPQRIPAGDLLIRSRLPFGPELQVLLDAIGQSRTYETNFGIEAPPPIEVQNQLESRTSAALVRDLEGAKFLDSEALKRLRRRASCSDEEDGFMLVPAFTGDSLLGRALFGAIDIHEFGSCPLQGWLREELSSFSIAAQRYFGWNEAELRAELSLECIGGKAGLEPGLCESLETEEKFKILMSHIFYHALLVAARASAARFHLGPDEGANAIEAKEINDSLRQIIELYIGADPTPSTDTIAHKLLPHQLLMTERLARGLRRFVIGHELGHVLLRKTGGNFPDMSIPWDTYKNFSRVWRAPEHRVERWSTEMACDVIGVRLMQESAPGDKAEISDDRNLQSVWDYAGIRLFFTLWAHILNYRARLGKVTADTHPPPDMRLTLLDEAFPSWTKELGKALGNGLDVRLRNL